MLIMLLIISIIFIMVILYYISISNNSKELNIILDKKICPKCQKNLNSPNVLYDIQKGGCSGTDTIIIECNCGYSKSFSIPSNPTCGI